VTAVFFNDGYLEVAGVRRRGYRLPIHRDDQTTFQMIRLGVKRCGQDRRLDQVPRSCSGSVMAAAMR
jgi:hypothetical protein